MSCRHQLVPDEELGSLYDLLIDEPPEIRRAIGALVYDHLIAQKFNSSQSTGFLNYVSLRLLYQHLFKCLHDCINQSFLLQVMKMIPQRFILVECYRFCESFQLIKFLVPM